MSHSINKANIIEGVADRKHWYSCTFFKENNSDGSFHVPEENNFYYKSIPNNSECTFMENDSGKNYPYLSNNLLIYKYVFIPPPSARGGCDTRSIF